MPFIRDCLSNANPLVQREITALVCIKANHLRARQFYLLETRNQKAIGSEVDVAEAEKGYVPSVGDTVELSKDKNGYLEIKLVKGKDKVIERNVKAKRKAASLKSSPAHSNVV